jgi:hypothetical protein
MVIETSEGERSDPKYNPEGSKSNKKMTTKSDMKMADENSLALNVISHGNSS